MEKAFIRECIQEYGRMKRDSDNGEVTLAETALFIEDVFCVTLKDEDICTGTLGDLKEMERLVIKKLKNPARRHKQQERGKDRPGTKNKDWEEPCAGSADT